ncbi:glycosyltransferase family 2 protein [Microbacterium sp. W4I20]|uniref:glycosyltransferase family 2 protein n=1 Tax=Microbacterium sp. W4I20 TaxID=3042262 RepID=UPI00278B263E|nr:glycosyltransferase [Microbacterium sp. W4I20]MDQ0725931.1 hypothetical protein [Microbacterium sp. W4I20]
MSSDSPLVDVVIAVHNDRRPVERAAASVLATKADLRLTVVAHNVEPHAIVERLGALAKDPRVRVLALADGVRSPANAFNHGLDAATGVYVTIIGSDDTLEAGALDAWVALAEQHRADAVIAPVVRDGGFAVPTPRIRSRRRIQVLDADRDRLFERTAALGLQRRATTSHLRYTADLPRGVDQEYGLRLWTSGRVVFDARTPAYREHADQDDRVTHAFGRLIDDFAFLDGFLRLVSTLPAPLRRASVAKVIRVHVIPAVRNRVDAGSLDAADVDAAAAVLDKLTSAAPAATRLLPRELDADLDAIRRRSMVAAAAANGRGASRAGSIVPRAPWLLLHRHAPLRSLAAGRAVMRQVSAAYRLRSSRQGASSGRSGG